MGSHKNLNSFMNIFLLMLTSFISLTLSDILNLWFIMEINNLIFIFYLLITSKNKKAIVLFFLIQAISSFYLLLSILSDILTASNKIHLLSSLMSFFSLILKLGSAPLHFWILMMTMHMNWYAMTIFFTIQKTIPFILLSMIEPHSFYAMICIVMSMIIPPLSMINTNKFKSLFAYSSINQMGWMIILILITPKIWLHYFIFYSLSMFLTIYMIKTHKTLMNSWMKDLQDILSMKMLYIMMMMNMSGIPPFMFFLIKWYSIFKIMNLTTPNVLVFLMLLSSLMMTYIYINMMMKVSLHYKLNTKLIQPAPAPTLPKILIFHALSLSSIMFIL